MKTIKNWFALSCILTVGALFITSCGDDDPEPVEVNVYPTEITLGAEQGAEDSFTITTKGEWTITDIPSFVKVITPLSGKGTATVRIRTSAENNTSSVLQGTLVITVKGADSNPYVLITQLGGVESDCYAEPTNVLAMSDGLAFNFKYGRNTQYFYWDAFPVSEYDKMSKDEVIAKVATGNVSDRVIPKPEAHFSFYGLSPNSEYKIVTVCYASNGQRGDVTITSLKTKSDNSQPLANVTGLSYAKDNDENYYYACDIEKNTFCNQYYTYAAAGKDVFLTFYYMYEGINAALAWAIRDELQKNPDTHYTSLNSDPTVREQFTAAQMNNGTTYMEANPYTDNYFQIVTWATDYSGNLSGVLGGAPVDLTSDEAPKRTAGSRMLFTSMTKTNTLSTPKKLIFEDSDIQIFRIK